MYVGCSAHSEPLGGFGRAAAPVLSGAGGQGATGQAFPFDFCCVCPEPGGSLQEHHSAGGAMLEVALPSPALTR